MDQHAHQARGSAQAAAPTPAATIAGPDGLELEALSARLNSSSAVQRLQAMRPPSRDEGRLTSRRPSVAETHPPLQRRAIRIGPRADAATPLEAEVVQRQIRFTDGTGELDRSGFIDGFRNQSDVQRYLAGRSVEDVLGAAFAVLDGQTFATRKALQKKVVDYAKKTGAAKPETPSSAEHESGLGLAVAPIRFVPLGPYVAEGKRLVDPGLLQAVGVAPADPFFYKIGMLARAGQEAVCIRFAKLLQQIGYLVGQGVVGRSGVASLIEGLLTPWGRPELIAAEDETTHLDPRAARGGPLVGINVAVKGMIGELDGLRGASTHALAEGETVFSGSTYEDLASGVGEDVDISFIDAKGILHLVEAAYDGNALWNKVKGGGAAQKKRYQALAASPELRHTSIDELSEQQRGDKQIAGIMFAYSIPREAFEAILEWPAKEVDDLVRSMGGATQLLVDGKDRKDVLREKARQARQDVDTF